MNIVWFKRDLRLEDHAPFWTACELSEVIPLYIIEPTLWQQQDTSRRHWHFIHDSLKELDQSLRFFGGQLVIRTGDVLTVLEDFRQNLGRFTLWSHEETGNAWTFKRDIQVSQWCKSHDILWREYPSNGVVRRLKNRDDWSRFRNERMEKPIISLPKSVPFKPHVTSEPIPLKDVNLFSKSIEGVTQRGGRSEGLKTLSSFLRDRGRKYMRTLSKPGISARHCSRLSAHIAYGTLSVREIEQATKIRIRDLKDRGDPESKDLVFNLYAFLSRLAWRCHFVQKLEQQPEIETHCMHPNFEGMREPYFREDYFEAWKNGMTGYPLIDACMRSLIQNGWITFRMRAMLVSFASYDLWLDWRQTAPYLAGLFTDYEPGIHYAQFQMQSGVTGINAVRLYNPIKQSQDHDAEGKFILRYVPELKTIPPMFIHEPWKFHDFASLGYPPPIVDHKKAIQQAKERLSERRHTVGFKETAQTTYQKLGSRKTTLKKPKALPKTKENKQLSFDFLK